MCKISESFYLLVKIKLFLTMSLIPYRGSVVAVGITGTRTSKRSARSDRDGRGLVRLTMTVGVDGCRGCMTVRQIEIWNPPGDSLETRYIPQRMSRAEASGPKKSSSALRYPSWSTGNARPCPALGMVISAFSAAQASYIFLLI